MSRNVREQEKLAIEHLREYVPEDLLDRIPNVSRNIFFPESTYYVIEKANIIFSNRLDDYVIALVFYNNTKYICIKEAFLKSKITDESKYVSDENVLFGVGILLLNEHFLVKKEEISGYRIYDNFFGHSEDIEYKYPEVFEIIEDYYLFELYEKEYEIKYIEDLDRLIYIMYINAKYKDETELIMNLREILYLESSRCILSMLSNMFFLKDETLIFMQLYRCIEYLYLIYWAEEYSNKYGIKENKIKILKMFDLEKIRFSENKSIFQIIKKYSTEDAVDEYFEYIKKNVDNGLLESNNKIEHVSNYIYNTRCKIVHFKYGQEEIKDRKTFGKSVIHLSYIVKNLFQKMDTLLIEINEKLNMWERIPFLENEVCDE